MGRNPLVVWHLDCPAIWPCGLISSSLALEKEAQLYACPKTCLHSIPTFALVFFCLRFLDCDLCPQSASLLKDLSRGSRTSIWISIPWPVCGSLPTVPNIPDHLWDCLVPTLPPWLEGADSGLWDLHYGPGFQLGLILIDVYYSMQVGPLVKGWRAEPCSRWKGSQKEKYLSGYGLLQKWKEMWTQKSSICLFFDQIVCLLKIYFKK